MSGRVLGFGRTCRHALLPDATEGVRTPKERRVYRCYLWGILERMRLDIWCAVHTVVVIEDLFPLGKVCGAVFI